MSEESPTSWNPGTASRQQALAASLYAIARTCDHADDPDAALDGILKEILNRIPADAAAIALKNPDSDLFDLRIINRTGVHSDNLELPPGVGVAGWVALHGQPLSIADIEADTRFLSLLPDSRAEMAAPMLANGAITGVITVNAHQPNHFDANDLEALSLLTAEAARAVDLLWTLRQLKIKASQLQSLIATGSTLISSRNADSILNHIVTEANALTGCAVCTICLCDTAANSLNLRAISTGATDDIGRYTIDLDQSALAVAIQRNRQVEVHSLSRSGEIHQLPHSAADAIESLICTPISLEGSVIGVLNAYSSTLRRFNNDEKTIFSALADLGAVAIQNSNLYSRIFSSEERLRKNERLTTLGMLSAEIAHEIRNPLTVIRLLFDSLDFPFSENDPRVEDTRIIGEKLNHLESIVAKVLQFGGSQDEVRTAWPLDSIVSETLHLVRLKLDQNSVSIHHQPCPSPLPVAVNKGQIQQVLLNLILNSLAALPCGGRITITTRATDHNGHPSATLRLTDNGTGIPAALQGRIFESFLSASQHGTGLGLAISKRILKSHNGDILLVESSPGGSTFEINIPRVEA